MNVKVAAAIFVVLAVGSPRPPSAAAADWQIDETRSRLGFRATFEGAAFEGIFKRFDGTIRFDPEVPAQSRFDVHIDIASIDTGSRDLNEGMVLPEWFHSARYPWASFVSSTVRQLDAATFSVSGTLEVKGVSKPVQLPFRWNRKGDTARIDGETMLNRTEFNLGMGDWADPDIVGHEVQVWAELHLTRAP